MASRLIWIWWIRWWCSFVLLWTENIHLGKFGPKSQNCSFKMKVDTKTNSHMVNSIVMFICPTVNKKHYFLAAFLIKMSIFSLRWYLVPGLLWIHWIWWFRSFAQLWTKNQLSGQIWSKHWHCLLKMKFRIETSLNNSSIMQIWSKKLNSSF